MDEYELLLGSIQFKGKSNIYLVIFFLLVLKNEVDLSLVHEHCNILKEDTFFVTVFHIPHFFQSVKDM